MELDFNNNSALAKSCEGFNIVISAVSGLRPVIVGFQKNLLKAAVSAGVPRFIPSDYSIDYSKVPMGENRNLNLREEFRKILDQEKSIRAISILNGAFMNLLTGVAPFILFPINSILCWGDKNQLMDWTTIEGTALYTAHVALDDSTPRYLKISGDQLSAVMLAQTMTELSHSRHIVLKPGNLAFFKLLISMTKITSPQSQSLHPPWKGMQYVLHVQRKL